MQNLIFSAKAMFQCLVLALSLPFLACAQTDDPVIDRFNQLLQRMDEQMRRGMPFDTTFSNGRIQFSPDSSSYFYFRIDTSFNGLDGGFFDFSPFEDHFGQDFFNSDPFFKRFFDGGVNPFAWPGQPGELPADDGELSGEDGLLPEERLRQEKDKAKGEVQPKKPAKGKVETIRI